MMYLINVCANGFACVSTFQSIRLDEFEQQQTLTSGQIAQRVKQRWPSLLKNTVQQGLKECKKGNYDLHEHSRYHGRYLKYCVFDEFRACVQ